MENHGLIQSKAIRWAVLHADFSEYNSGGNAGDDDAPVSNGATPSAVQRYDQEELLTLQALVKVLNGLKKEFHKVGSNLNQEAYSMNYAREQGDLHFTKDDVDSTNELRAEIREIFDDISSLVSYIDELCRKQ